MGESSEHKQARQQEQALAQQQQAMQQQNFALQNRIYGQISPFAQGLLNMGTQAQQGIAPDSFQLGTRNALASAFGQQRQNLADFLGQSGQGFSGLAAGPAANLGAQESTAMGQAYADALNQALGLGLQGSNILQGQQGVFNPVPYGSLATQGFQNYTNATPQQSFGQILGQSLLGSAIGAGTTALKGAFGMCWIAMELYGEDSPKTRDIRFLLTYLHKNDYESQLGQWASFYMEHGEEVANRIKSDSVLRKHVKSLFDKLAERASHTQFIYGPDTQQKTD